MEEAVMSGLDDLVKGMTGGSSGAGGLGDILGGLAGSSSGGGGLGDILGGILGGGSTGGSSAPSGSSGLGGMLTALLPMLGSLLAGGGLQKILSGLQANGLTAETDSWVGTGENKPVSGADVRQAVGDDEIARIAQQLGISDDEAAEAVAQVLPVVVDKVSPDGQLEPDDELSSAFDNLKQLGG
jgi:uncharacterized protein YidB (DUF937 family)